MAHLAPTPRRRAPGLFYLLSKGRHKAVLRRSRSRRDHADHALPLTHPAGVPIAIGSGTVLMTACQTTVPITHAPMVRPWPKLPLPGREAPCRPRRGRASIAKEVEGVCLHLACGRCSPTDQWLIGALETSVGSSVE